MLLSICFAIYHRVYFCLLSSPACLLWFMSTSVLLYYKKRVCFHKIKTSVVKRKNDFLAMSFIFQYYRLGGYRCCWSCLRHSGYHGVRKMAVLLLPGQPFVGLPWGLPRATQKVLLVSCSKIQDHAVLCQPFSNNDCLHFRLLYLSCCHPRVAMGESLQGRVAEIPSRRNTSLLPPRKCLPKRKLTEVPWHEKFVIKLVLLQRVVKQ